MADLYPHITDPSQRQMLGLPQLAGFNGWIRQGAGGGDPYGFNGWMNVNTGQYSTVDPSSPTLAPTYYGGQDKATFNQVTSNGGDSSGFGSPAATGLGALEYQLEQALDPYRRAAGIDLAPYMQGLDIRPDYGTNQEHNLQQANALLSRLYAADPSAFRGGQFKPWSNVQDLHARQNQRAGFNEGLFGGTLGDLIGLGVGTAGFGVGGVSGASAATGGGVTPQTLALDAAGLGAGAGLAGIMGAPVAGGTTAGTAGLTDAQLLEMAGVTPTYSSAAPFTVGAGSGAAFPWMSTAPAGSVLSAGAAVPAAGVLGMGSVYSPSTVPFASTPGVPTGPTTAATTAGTTAGTTGGAAASGGISGILSNPMTLGMLGGAALGGLSGSEQAGTMTVNEGLPDWLLPYAKPQLDKYSTDLQNYQIDPYGIMPSAMQEFQRTISGQYLDPSTNKYLADYFKLGAERIKGSLSPSFGHMQAFGQHSGYNEALSRGLGDFSTMLYGGAYEKERDRQNQLTAAAPGFLAGSSTAAFTPYQQYLGTLSSLGKKKEQPLYENPWGDVLGGAMAGGSLGWMFGGGGKK